MRIWLHAREAGKSGHEKRLTSAKSKSIVFVESFYFAKLYKSQRITDSHYLSICQRINECEVLIKTDISLSI